MSILQVRAYANVRKPPMRVVEELLKMPVPGQNAHRYRCVIPWVNTDYPGRAGVIQEEPYRFDGEWQFQAGTNSSHFLFRQHLCNVLGLGDFGAWFKTAEVGGNGPFEELLYFSDEGGTLGPEVSRKLAKDFADFEEAARAYAVELNGNGELEGAWSYGGDFWAKYQKWKFAFEFASGSGVRSDQIGFVELDG